MTDVVISCDRCGRSEKIDPRLGSQALAHYWQEHAHSATVISLPGWFNNGLHTFCPECCQQLERAA